MDAFMRNSEKLISLKALITIAAIELGSRWLPKKHSPEGIRQIMARKLGSSMIEQRVISVYPCLDNKCVFSLFYYYISSQYVIFEGGAIVCSTTTHLCWQVAKSGLREGADSAQSIMTNVWFGHKDLSLGIDDRNWRSHYCTEHAHSTPLYR